MIRKNDDFKAERRFICLRIMVIRPGMWPEMDNYL
jgi:hypothetical protein